MGGWLPWPKHWPTTPLQLAPPAEALYPNTLEELSLLELAEAAALLRIACGRSDLLKNNPRRAILCVLATIVDYELLKRNDHKL